MTSKGIDDGRTGRIGHHRLDRQAHGHRAPSGKVEPKRLIKKLDCVEDVRESNKRASRIISSTVTRIVREYGGDFSESNVTRAAIQALS